jgi:hypothetical protein
MQAVFGLIGVIIGALLTGTSNYLFAKRGERLAARIAARLLREDLYLVACWIEDAITDGKWPSNPGTYFDPALWKEQRIHIAKITSYPDYSAVTQAVSAVERMNSRLKAIERHREITEADKGSLKQWLADLAEGLAVLKSLAQ